MPWGEILRLESDKGFGFIRDDSGMDWFFVAKDVRGGRFENIWVGERVGFTAEATASGPRAADIHHEQLD
ncbi:MAG: cold shock domain-containing protein [Acidobacteria bacterium]|nr:cold shock domain-containing protein [Acidobacteriota bacterium]